MAKAKRSDPGKPRGALKIAIEKYGSEKLERIQRRVKGSPTSDRKTAERMLYDKPINRQASEEFKYKK